MAGDAFSLDFFKQMAMRVADRDNNGQINNTIYQLNGETIDEKSIFDTEFKKFDMNQDGKVDNDDVSMYKQSFKIEQSDSHKTGFTKMHGSTKFYLKVLDTLDYLLSLGKINQEEYDKYEESARNFNNDIILNAPEHGISENQ